MTRKSRMLATVTVAITLGGGLAVLPATAALAAYTCNYSQKSYLWYAGYYSGTTVQPSSTSVTSAGIEAQCLLRHYNYNPGTIDGIFGAKSQAAAKDFQQDMNDNFGYHLTEDGKIGKESWPPLRSQP